MVSGSMSKLSNSTTISDILGAKIMKVQSRLLGYFSGKPGVFITPLGAVKFLEHSGPVGTDGSDELHKCELLFRESENLSLGHRCELSRGRGSSRGHTLGSL